jgi:sugar transferase (PEP-CTERM system associated)
MDVIGWAGALGSDSDPGALAETIDALRQRRGVDRLIVAMRDRRGTTPVRELLALRLAGICVEEATTLLEKISGRIELDGLHPSWLIYSDGFRQNVTFMLARRATSIVISLSILLVFLPVLPIIALAVKLSSPGPILYKQKRVAKNGAIFYCYKFRTMLADAEADTGPTWAGDEDPRITWVGRILRLTRLDELPQLWNVLRGDMAFIGPRPERPEFVDSLTREIPYYSLRHVIRPGLTGWAQVRYQYGSSIEESKQKLQYDLYYIKHMSLGLDLLIMFETIKTIVSRRGAQ